MDNEATIQAKARLLTSKQGWRMYRNNVGVLVDVNGRPIRYGLANESKVMNEQYKSGDLIGIRPLLVTEEMVGRLIGQFASIECKREGWRKNLNDPHTQAQQRWADLVNSLGGYAVFYSGIEPL